MRFGVRPLLELEDGACESGEVLVTVARSRHGPYRHPARGDEMAREMDENR